jgi:hypothetical protein
MPASRSKQITLQLLNPRRRLLQKLAHVGQFLWVSYSNMLPDALIALGRRRLKPHHEIAH